MMDSSTRRDFLSALGLTVTSIVFTARSSEAQDQEKPTESPKDEERYYDELFGTGDESEENGSEDNETRACPQCGALMYRQGKTWTCETCGYSYVE